MALEIPPKSQNTNWNTNWNLASKWRVWSLKWQTPPMGLSLIASMFSCHVPFFVQLARIQLFTLPLAQEKVLDGLTTYTYQLESPSQAKTTSLWHLLSPYKAEKLIDISTSHRKAVQDHHPTESKANKWKSSYPIYHLYSPTISICVA